MSRSVIDLSYTVKHAMEVFPADPPVGILKHHCYQNGYFVSQIIMGTHSGTHVDAPVHKLPGTRTITDLRIEQYIGWQTAVLDFTEHQGEITRADCLKYEARLDACDAVIFKTGWEQKFGTAAFFRDYGGLHEDVALLLEEKGIRLIGLETPSVHPVRHQEVHEALLNRNILIVESLAHVSAITKPVVEFHAVPLKLKNLDGSPVRAYALE